MCVCIVSVVSVLGAQTDFIIHSIKQNDVVSCEIMEIGGEGNEHNTTQ